MRSDPVNSPQAAARIVALTLVADGDIGAPEIAWLDRLVVHEQLGLTRDALHALLDTFCEDLLSSGQLRWSDACPVDERTLSSLMDEIQDPALRLNVLRLCVDLAEVDARVEDGESSVLNAAVEHWGLHRAMFRAWPQSGLTTLPLGRRMRSSCPSRPSSRAGSTARSPTSCAR